MSAQTLVQRLRERADPARSPVLAGVLDAIAVRLAASLSGLVGAPVSANRAPAGANGGESGNGDKTGDKTGDTWLRAAFRIAPGDASGAATLSRRDLHLLTDVLFGGEGGEPLSPDRPVSALERHVASAILTRAAEAVRDAFAPVSPFDVTPGGLEQAEIRAAKGLDVVFRFACGGRNGLIALDLPHDILAALGDASRAERPRKPVDAIDPAWAQNLRGEVSRAPVAVQGVLEEGGFTLADLAALRVGSVLRLEAGAQSSVVLSSRGRALFRGRLGQSSGAYTIQIEGAAHEAPFDPQQTAESCDG